MKFLPVGAEFLHADGQTDITKLIDAFRNFANAYKLKYQENICPTVNLSYHKSHMDCFGTETPNSRREAVN
jgi:hypothetical protein